MAKEMKPGRRQPHQAPKLTKMPMQSTAKSTATHAQHVRILRALRRGPKTTEQLRALGSFAPASRIKELREAGFLIETQRVTVTDRDSFVHARVAKYVLRREPEAL